MKRLLKYFNGYKKECVLGPLFKLFEATLELIVPLVIAEIIDHGIGNGDGGYVVMDKSGYLTLTEHGIEVATKMYE